MTGSEHEAWAAAVDWVLNDPPLAELCTVLDALGYAWQHDGATGVDELKEAVGDALHRLLHSGIAPEPLQSLLERWSAIRGNGLTVTLTLH